MLSSQVLAEAAAISDRLPAIAQGRIVLDPPALELRGRAAGEGRELGELVLARVRTPGPWVTLGGAL